jgi:hypothetical protein
LLPLSQEELPAVAEACAGAARGLAAAYAEVEAGRAADHPKLAELHACLLGFRALHPVQHHIADQMTSTCCGTFARAAHHVYCAAVQNSPFQMDNIALI